jgi:hypothetical protein
MWWLSELDVCLVVWANVNVVWGMRHQAKRSSSHDENVMIIIRLLKNYPCYRNTQTIQTMIMCVLKTRSLQQRLKLSKKIRRPVAHTSI